MQAHLFGISSNYLGGGQSQQVSGRKNVCSAHSPNWLTNSPQRYSCKRQSPRGRVVSERVLFSGGEGGGGGCLKRVSISSLLVLNNPQKWERHTLSFMKTSFYHFHLCWHWLQWSSALMPVLNRVGNQMVMVWSSRPHLQTWTSVKYLPECQRYNLLVSQYK